MIDDSMLACEMVKRVFQGSRMTVFSACSGAEGLRGAKENKPDLILLDLTLKGEDGYAICEMLKKDAALANIPIVFITSTNDAHSIARAFEVGAVDYICKPFSEVELVARVKAHLKYKFVTDALKRMNRRLIEAFEENNRLAMKDPLTDLYNRRYLWERMRDLYRTREEGLSAALFILDIDNFKQINDTYGHGYGDVVLEKVAQIIQEGTLNAGCAGRWGGEEFLVILSPSTIEEAMATAEEVRKKIECHHFINQGKRVFCTATIGLAPVDFSRDIEYSINAADQGLYEGKAGGKNCCIPKTA